MAIRGQVERAVRRFWGASPALMGAVAAFVPALALSLVGLVADDRTIAGDPAWLKPAKFAASSGVYCLTLAWLIASVGRPSRLLRRAGATVAAVLVLEVGIIDLQAARGTTSHFNRATPVDAALFGAMGLAILVLVLASAAAAVELCRAEFADRAWGWALRLGLVVAVVGSTTGGLMVRPTAAQLARAEATGAMPIVGQHTVGGPDGGPSLPVTGWSRAHGDLRVPHFVGLHAVQAIPLLAWLAFRGLRPRSDRARTGLVAVIAASYAAATALLTVQAMAGRPALAGDLPTLGGLGLWAVLTAGGVAAVLAGERPRAGIPVHAVGA